jgi:hypothetical protein
MQLTSHVAMWCYEQIPHGIDRVIGSTALTASDQPVPIPDGTRWYVRHHDPGIAGPAIGQLVAESRRLGIPGLSFASCPRVDDQVVGELTGLDHLRTLDLFNTPVGDAGLAALAQQLPALTSLNLAGTAVTDAGMVHVAKLGALEILHLGWTDVGDRGVAALAALPAVKTIILHGTGVSDAGMAELARFAIVEAVDVQETRIGDAGVAALVPLASQLRRLYLGYTAITDGCVESLRRLVRLRTLMLRATRVSVAHDGELARALSELGGADTGPGGTQEGLIR